MPKIYAFDNRDGTVNEQVHAHRPRKPAQASVESWKRHPKITWRADPTPSTPVPPVQPLRPVPATEMARLERYGGCEAAAMLLAGEPPSALSERAAALEPRGGGTYEALMRWRREHAHA